MSINILVILGFLFDKRNNIILWRVSHSKFPFWCEPQTQCPRCPPCKTSTKHTHKNALCDVHVMALPKQHHTLILLLHLLLITFPFLPFFLQLQPTWILTKWPTSLSDQITHAFTDHTHTPLLSKPPSNAFTSTSQHLPTSDTELYARALSKMWKKHRESQKPRPKLSLTLMTCRICLGTGHLGRIFLQDTKSSAPHRWPLLSVTWTRLLLSSFLQVLLSFFETPEAETGIFISI